MKPAAFDYVRPGNLAEAFAALGEAGVDARVLAGGQSLLPMLNLRVAYADRLVDVGRLPELLIAEDYPDAVRLGAAITHLAIEDGAVPDPSRGLMAKVAADLAYRAVRSRGTIGGSLALADPAADWPPVLVALGASVTIAGPGGTRSLLVADFITGPFATDLAADEILLSIEIPKLSDAGRWGYAKLARKAGAFATALAIAVLDPTRGRASLVLGAAEGAPLSLTSAAAALTGPEPALAAAIDQDLTASGRHLDDYQAQILRVMALRAARQVRA